MATDSSDPTPARESAAECHRPRAGTWDGVVQQTRAWTGLLVVVGGDVTIAVAAILGLSLIESGTKAVVAILTVSSPRSAA